MDTYNDTGKSVLNMSLHECDIRIKQILSDRLILAQIMKGCIPEYAKIPVKEIADNYIENEPEVGSVPVDRDETNVAVYRKGSKIAGANTEDKTDTEGTVYYDIRFYAAAPSGSGHNRFIINIEAQKNYHPGYPIVKRGEYYCCRSISAQNGVDFEKGHYGDIQKVYSIWICYDAGKDKNTMVSYAMRKNEIIGHVEEPKENYDLMEVIIIGLGDPKQVETGSALHFLDVLFSRSMKVPEILDTMEKDYEIPTTQKIEEGVNDMCNISAGMRDVFLREGREIGKEEGIKIGETQGEARGEARGEAKGILKTLKKNILNMRAKHLSDEMIADFLEISVAEVKAIAAT